MKAIQKLLWTLSLLLCLVSLDRAFAFCGFYVGKADAKLYNQASQVVLARHENKTVVSMLNDYQGDLKEFAMVIPIPEVLKEGQIHVGDRKLFERIDAYSAPRLVEYHDPNPCHRYELSSHFSGALRKKTANALNIDYYLWKYSKTIQIQNFDFHRTRSIYY